MCSKWCKGKAWVISPNVCSEILARCLDVHMSRVWKNSGGSVTLGICTLPWWQHVENLASTPILPLWISFLNIKAWHAVHKYWSVPSLLVNGRIFSPVIYCSMHPKPTGWNPRSSSPLQRGLYGYLDVHEHQWTFSSLAQFMYNIK